MPPQRDFLSIELIEGCLRLTFDLGSGPLVLTSSRKYNLGVWYKVTLQRNRRKGKSRPQVQVAALFRISDDKRAHVCVRVLRLHVDHGGRPII